MLAGCGRIAFDPLDDGSHDAALPDAPPNMIVRHSAGGLNTCVLLASGDAWCWGFAENNGTGDTVTHTGVPRRVDTTMKLVSLETSDAGSCSLIGDHRAVCWGRNDRGQLGVGTMGVVATPQLIVGKTQVAEISIGYAYACLRRLDGTVGCSGASQFLGTGEVSDRTTFNTIPGITTARAITAGDQHACVLLQSGAVTCWGGNALYQLGDQTTSFQPTPVSGPAGPYSEIAAGDDHTCGLRNGVIECWGSDVEGDLGDNSLVSRSTPMPVFNITDATAVVGLAHGTCALRATGTVACWGGNTQGAVGDGLTSGTHLVPYQLALTGVTSISGRTSLHVCALLNGTLWCWGGNTNGQLGRSFVGGDSGDPLPVIGLPPP